MRLPLIAALLLLPAAARAQIEGEGDTVYGRLSYDLVVSAGLGGGVAFGDPGGPEITGTTTLELKARLLDSAGLMIAPEWRPAGDSRVVIAAELRPVFFIRFLLNQQTGDRHFDLFLDSIGFDLGAAITPLADEVGAALSFGFGLEVPLFFTNDDSDGMLLRLSARSVNALPTDQYGPANGTSDFVVLAVLTYRAGVSIGIATWEPARYELPEE